MTRFRWTMFHEIAAITVAKSAILYLQRHASVVGKYFLSDSILLISIVIQF